ncbi:ATP-binding SpoIIE family protein phosphatase [Streptomyces griseochromogenes]|uniref:ATP-binding SpoIIE family protein phosphatase n=1 Tax=Streptomyces griseochromogenes TaxID=68214 RepID=UPI0037B58C12
MGVWGLPYGDGVADGVVDPFDFATAALVMVDAAGLIECWSPEAEKLLGYSSADVLGHPASAVLDSQDGLAALVEGRLVADSWEGRISVRHHGGHSVELGLRVRALRVPCGRGGWIAALCSAAALQRWELGQATMQGLLTQSPIGIAVLDTQLRCEWCNEALATMEGLPAEESAAVPERHRGGLPAIERQAGRALATGEVLSAVEHEAPQPGVTGQVNAEHLRLRTSFPLRARTGATLGVCQTAMDFIDRERDKGRRRLVLVNEAGERIGTTLELGRTVEELAEVLVPQFADFVAVDLVDGVRPPEDLATRPRKGQGGLYRAAHLSIRSDDPEAVVAIGAPTHYPAQSPQSRCLATGLSVRDADVSASTAWLDGDPLRLDAFRRIGVHSHMVVPLRARGVTAGVVTMLRWENPDAFDEDDQLLVEELSGRAAVCVDNARRFAREHSAALALQTSLLPPALPDLSAVEVAYRYLPADAEAGVGGDWFDVIPLSGARVALVVGDVVGHGIHAAASMGRLRAAVQTLADMDLPPEELLTHVDDLVLRLSEEAEAASDGVVIGATCVYAVYDPIGRKLSVARAGHPSPGLAHQSEPVEILDVPAGPPLGLGGFPFESVEFDVEEGSVMALFTDGLIEASDHDVDAGLERLCFALAHPDRPLEEICDTMVRTLLPDRPRDDVACLVVRTRGLDCDRVATWDIPSTPSSVAEARSEVVAQLARWNLDDIAFTTELIVSELVTNAMKHAHGPIGLRLIHDRTLICEVSDASNTSPRLRRARSSDEGGRGLFLVAQLAQRWGTRYTTPGKTIWTEQPLPARAHDVTRAATAE